MSCRRGYSSEQQRGRWLLQKLDYLQLLLVKRAIGGLTRLGGHLLQQARSLNQRKPKLSQSKVQRRVQRQLPANSRKGKMAAKQAPADRAGSASSSSSNGSSRQLRRQSSSKQPRTDAFGRPYSEDINVQPGTEEASSSSVRLEPGSPLAPDGLDRSSSSSSSSSSNGSDADNYSALDELQQQQQPQQQRRKNRGLWGQVSSRAEQSYRDVLHTLSDWGFIPRMDVTPLEVFDEVGVQGCGGFFCCTVIVEARLSCGQGAVSLVVIPALGLCCAGMQHAHAKKIRCACYTTAACHKRGAPLLLFRRCTH
jgi:hypothetical protein